MDGIGGPPPKKFRVFQMAALGRPFRLVKPSPLPKRMDENGTSQPTLLCVLPDSQIQYDDLQSIGDKLDYAIELNLGVGFWALTYEHISI